MKIYQTFLEKLKKGEPFKFSRWGDGEWLCMAGEEGTNRDGNDYLPELGKALRDIIASDPDYYMGIQYGVFYNEKYPRGQSGPSLRQYMIQNLFDHPLNWVMGDVFHLAAEFGYLKEFVDVLKDRYVIYVGAEYFIELPFVRDLIELPPCNSYYENENTHYVMNGYASAINVYDPVFIVSAAMNSNVIIDLLPDHCTAIDMGSVFDPWLGRPRASYQHNMKTYDLW